MANEFRIKNGLIISGSLPDQSSEQTILTIDSSGLVGTKEQSADPQIVTGKQGVI